MSVSGIIVVPPYAVPACVMRHMRCRHTQQRHLRVRSGEKCRQNKFEAVAEQD